MAAPGAVARAKQVLRAQVTPPISPEMLRKLQVAFKATARSDEAEEGRRSFQREAQAVLVSRQDLIHLARGRA